MEEVTHREVDPVFIPDSRNYISKIVLDIAKIHHETGWSPKTGINEGVKKTWEWLNAQ
jgi:nucleoside-diphosphate-sugar epimerase